MNIKELVSRREVLLFSGTVVAAELVGVGAGAIGSAKFTLDREAGMKDIEAKGRANFWREMRGVSFDGGINGDGQSVRKVINLVDQLYSERYSRPKSGVIFGQPRLINNNDRSRVEVPRLGVSIADYPRAGQSSDELLLAWNKEFLFSSIVYFGGKPGVTHPVLDINQMAIWMIGHEVVKRKFEKIEDEKDYVNAGFRQYSQKDPTVSRGSVLDRISTMVLTADLLGNSMEREVAIASEDPVYSSAINNSETLSAYWFRSLMQNSGMTMRRLEELRYNSQSMELGFEFQRRFAQQGSKIKPDLLNTLQGRSTSDRRVASDLQSISDSLNPRDGILRVVDRVRAVFWPRA